MSKEESRVVAEVAVVEHPVNVSRECETVSPATSVEAAAHNNDYGRGGYRYAAPLAYSGAVTRLFEYVQRAWEGQRGEHCTYKYISQPGSTEVCASVIVRLPNRDPLLVRDDRYRFSRSAAQNTVAQMALDRLCQPRGGRYPSYPGRGGYAGKYNPPPAPEKESPPPSVASVSTSEEATYTPMPNFLPMMPHQMLPPMVDEGGYPMMPMFYPPEYMFPYFDPYQQMPYDEAGYPIYYPPFYPLFVPAGAPEPHDQQ